MLLKVVFEEYVSVKEKCLNVSNENKNYIT